MDLSGLAALFVGAHVQLAAATNTPELAITDDEGEEFLKRAQNVLRHYSIETTQKTLDWIAFYGSVGMMYGTRAIAIYNRQRSERQPQPRRGEVIRPERFRPRAPVEAPAVAAAAPQVDRTGALIPDVAGALDIQGIGGEPTEDLAT